MTGTLITQRNDLLYITSKLEVIEPSTEEIASFGFAKQVIDQSPNSKILWLSGHYVEADVPNRNGQMWAAGEVAIKSLTPRLMPVTMMHDPKTAVGVIAHSELSLPSDEHASEGQRASINTILAIWSHRFPEAAEEIKLNHDAGTLMQSMECDSPSFTCSECAQEFVKPCDEREWCSHLQNGTAVRTLLDVTFTGTGLIFGSRGASGANPRAQLSVLAEVAEWSDSRKSETKKERRTMPVIEIEKSEYDSLVDRAAKLDAAEKAQAEAVSAAGAASTVAKDVEDKLTVAEKDLESKTAEAAALQVKVSEFEESAAQAELASKRMSEVPAELAKALPEGAKVRLVIKARNMSDEDWTDELASTAELLKVKTDGPAAGSVFAEEAIHGFNPAGNLNTNENSKTEIANMSAAAPAVGSMLRNLRKPASK